MKTVRQRRTERIVAIPVVVCLAVYAVVFAVRYPALPERLPSREFADGEMSWIGKEDLLAWVRLVGGAVVALGAVYIACSRKSIWLELPSEEEPDPRQERLGTVLGAVASSVLCLAVLCDRLATVLYEHFHALKQAALWLLGAFVGLMAVAVVAALVGGRRRLSRKTKQE